MNKKKIIISISCIILLTVIGLWIGGVIPKAIAKTVATNYLKSNFPKKQFEYVGIEWNPYFDGYTIQFKDEKNKNVGFIMDGKYLPISVGQGRFALEEEYREEYGQNK